MISPDVPPEVLDEEQLMAMALRLENIPLDEAEWVAELFMECRRARESEARLLAESALQNTPSRDEDITQLVLDTTQWLKTLWNVGYLGNSLMPAQPRSEFPQIEVEDILKSALFARIRQGKPPLPFPPPTRQGMPWHEIVESLEEFTVEASILHDEEGKPQRAVIEGCRFWHILESAPPAYLVQHQGKGPRYHLTREGTESATARLQREAPSKNCRIIQQFRAGYRSFMLEWPYPDGRMRAISLKATHPERAISEAHSWLAHHHPEDYGRISFTVVDA